MDVIILRKPVKKKSYFHRIHFWLVTLKNEAKLMCKLFQRILKDNIFLWAMGTRTKDWFLASQIIILNTCHRSEVVKLCSISQKNIKDLKFFLIFANLLCMNLVSVYKMVGKCDWPEYGSRHLISIFKFLLFSGDSPSQEISPNYLHQSKTRN